MGANGSNGSPEEHVDHGQLCQILQMVELAWYSMSNRQFHSFTPISCFYLTGELLGKGNNVVVVFLRLRMLRKQVEGMGKARERDQLDLAALLLQPLGIRHGIVSEGVNPASRDH